MSLRINLNTAAMSASRYLGATDNALGKSIEKLSSGYRVNRASDDPAGLVISQKLRAQIGGLGQAISNSNDAINMVKTAEGALNETHSLLLSMRDLAVHAANAGVNDDASLDADQLQIASAIDSLNRIAANTQFGNKKLLDGSAGTSATVIDTTKIASVAPASTTPAGYVDVDVTTAATKAALTGSNTGYANAAATVDNAGTITINGTSFTVGAADTVQSVIDQINGATSTTGVSASFAAGGVVLAQSSFGSDKGIAYTESADILNGGSTGVQWGGDAVATVTYGDATTETFNAGKGLQLVGATSGMTINLTTTGNHAGTGDSTDGIFVESGKMTFQVGAYAGQTVEFALSSVAASQLGVTATGLTNTSWTVASIDVKVVGGADDALRLLDAAISEVSTTRANLGAFQKNILESNVNSLGIARENIAASESSVRDTDMAAEMVTFTRNQILTQAGTAMLAQANQVPQTLLRLLQ